VNKSVGTFQTLNSPVPRSPRRARKPSHADHLGVRRLAIVALSSAKTPENLSAQALSLLAATALVEAVQPLEVHVTTTEAIGAAEAVAPGQSPQILRTVRSVAGKVTTVVTVVVKRATIPVLHVPLVTVVKLATAAKPAAVEKPATAVTLAMAVKPAMAVNLARLETLVTPAEVAATTIAIPAILGTTLAALATVAPTTEMFAAANVKEETLRMNHQ